MRLYWLVGPFVPPLDELLPVILVHQSLDRWLADAENGGQFPEQVGRDVARLLKEDDLVGLHRAWTCNPCDGRFRRSEDGVAVAAA